MSHLARGPAIAGIDSKASDCQAPTTQLWLKQGVPEALS